MFDWIANNTEMIAIGWGLLTGLAEILKRVIKGKKDDRVIVKVLDITGKILTLGGATLLPNQDGRH